MKQRYTLYFIGWLATSMSAWAQPASNSPRFTQFDQLLTQQFNDQGPGCAALVAKKGQIIYQKALGMANLELAVPMQTDKVFRIGSMTKQFTAIAILQLMEQGKLSLQDEITRFIPDYPTQGKTITLEHLLTHTSGIKSYTNMKEFGTIDKQDLTPPQLIDFFKNQPLVFEPGTQWSYNNSGYFLLGYIIEKVTGKTYAQYLVDAFFKPLGMNHSYYGSNAQLIQNRAAGYQGGKDGTENADYLSMSLPYAAGSIESTIGDLWIWHQALHRYKLVKKATLDRAFTNYKLKNGQPTNYSYGWFLNTIGGSPTIEHGGAINGFLTNGIYLPQEDVLVLVFSNSTQNSPDGVAEVMAAAAIGKYKDAAELVMNPALLQAYEGTYEGTYEGQAVGSSVITLTNNQLYWQPAGGKRIRLKPTQSDTFVLANSLDTLSFVRNGAGQLDYILYQNRLRTITWKKATRPVSSDK